MDAQHNGLLPRSSAVPSLLSPSNTNQLPILGPNRNNLITTQGFEVNTSITNEIFAKHLIGNKETDDTHFIIRNGKLWITMQKWEVEHLKLEKKAGFNEKAAGAPFHPQSDNEFLARYKSTKIKRAEYHILAVIVPDDKTEKKTRRQYQRTVIFELRGQSAKDLVEYRKALTGDKAWEWELDLPLRCAPSTLEHLAEGAKSRIAECLTKTAGGTKYLSCPRTTKQPMTSLDDLHRRMDSMEQRYKDDLGQVKALLEVLNKTLKLRG